MGFEVNFWIIGSIIFGLLIMVLILLGFRVLRPVERGLIERFGKYKRFANPGLNWIFPLGIEHLYRINITEMMVNAEPQEIITKDKLNARVDAQVYFKVKSDEESVKHSQYNVNDYCYQITNLARTTLRNIIGTMTLEEANSDRNKINTDLQTTLIKETSSWGIEVVRTELKEIDPPADVQETMNKVVKAANEKVAAIDFATATETTADGQKRAEIKKAEGIKQAKILAAEGEAEAIKKVAAGQAEAIKSVNEAAEKYFIGNAQTLKKLETVESAFKLNSKIIVPQGVELINIISDLAGTPVIPLPAKVKDSTEKK